jgi:hypothetical protein
MAAKERRERNGKNLTQRREDTKMDPEKQIALQSCERGQRKHLFYSWQRLILSLSCLIRIWSYLFGFSGIGCGNQSKSSDQKDQRV